VGYRELLSFVQTLPEAEDSLSDGADEAGIQ